MEGNRLMNSLDGVTRLASAVQQNRANEHDQLNYVIEAAGAAFELGKQIQWNPIKRSDKVLAGIVYDLKGAEKTFKMGYMMMRYKLSQSQPNSRKEVIQSCQIASGLYLLQDIQTCLSENEIKLFYTCLFQYITQGPSIKETDIPVSIMSSRQTNPDIHWWWVEATNSSTDTKWWWQEEPTRPETRDNIRCLRCQTYQVILKEKHTLEKQVSELKDKIIEMEAQEIRRSLQPRAEMKTKTYPNPNKDRSAPETYLKAINNILHRKISP